MRIGKSVLAVGRLGLGGLVVLTLASIFGCATGGALPSTAAREAVLAAIATARASMSADEAWAIIERKLHSFCEKKKSEAGPVSLNRTCTKIERSGFAYSETATLMKAHDFSDTQPIGTYLFGAIDRNGLVMSAETANVLAYDNNYSDRNGPIRLQIVTGNGTRVGKTANTVTWGPRNVDVSFGNADPVGIMLSRFNSDRWDCVIYKGVRSGPTAATTELIFPVYLGEKQMPRFVAALEIMWPEAQLVYVERDARKR